jgi:hypothetical protein
VRSRRFSARTGRRYRKGRRYRETERNSGDDSDGSGLRKIAKEKKKKRKSGRFLAENMIPFRRETLIENPSIRRISFSFFFPDVSLSSQRKEISRRPLRVKLVKGRRKRAIGNVLATIPRERGQKQRKGEEGVYIPEKYRRIVVAHGKMKT